MFNIIGLFKARDILLLHILLLHILLLHILLLHILLLHILLLHILLLHILLLHILLLHILLLHILLLHILLLHILLLHILLLHILLLHILLLHILLLHILLLHILLLHVLLLHILLLQPILNCLIITFSSSGPLSVTSIMEAPTFGWSTLFLIFKVPRKKLIRKFNVPKTSGFFISVFNQLDAQNLFHNKFYFMLLHVSSTCAHHQEVKIALRSLWYHHTYRCARDGHL